LPISGVPDPFRTPAAGADPSRPGPDRAVPGLAAAAGRHGADGTGGPRALRDAGAGCIGHRTRVVGGAPLRRPGPARRAGRVPATHAGRGGRGMSLPPGTVPPAVRAPVAAPRQTLWRWVGGVHVVAVAALCVAAVVIGAERCEGFACMVAAAIWLAWAGASVLVMG